jgi:hypothetical protein
MADSIPKPCPLEPNVQEILDSANVLFLAPEQHSDAWFHVVNLLIGFTFGEFL